MADTDSNRRLLDMLFGWAEATGPDWNIGAAGLPEHDQIADLYQEAGQIEAGDGEGIAYFVFSRLLYFILDGHYSSGLPKREIRPNNELEELRRYVGQTLPAGPGVQPQDLDQSKLEWRRKLLGEL